MGSDIIDNRYYQADTKDIILNCLATFEIYLIDECLKFIFHEIKAHIVNRDTQWYNLYVKNFEQDTKNLKKNVFPKCIFNENNLKTAISCALDHYPKRGPEGSQ